MFNTVDVYLGAFLILSGFTLSLLNLRSVLKNNKFSSVLLSENIFLMCIGVAFMSRAVYGLNIVNMHMSDMDGRMLNVKSTKHEDHSAQCTIWSMLLSYGPLIVSFVNSFMSLVIDNYLHYKMLKETKEKDEENMVQMVGEQSATDRKLKMQWCFMFWKKYFSYIVMGLQWIVPFTISLFMLPMGVNERSLKMTELPLHSDSCMAMMNLYNETCITLHNNHTKDVIALHSYHKPSDSYLEAYENIVDRNRSTAIGSVVKNLYKIISNIQNNSFANVLETSKILRQPKSSAQCMKICYIDSSNLLLYMFVLAIISYFVPITISTVILTKIHLMDVKKPNIKTYVSRELLYNILFWTPVMFDNILSLILCSYSTTAMKTSMLNVVANVYQAVKNFMNTKHFIDNTIVPA